jgi:predicted GNAT family acetyltransferase
MKIEDSSAVLHQPGAQRFTTRIDAHEAVLEYRLDGGVMTITHTAVPAAIGGRGVAAQLMRAAVDAARAAGWTIVPACSYAASYLQRQPPEGIRD